MALNPQQEKVAELIASGCTPAIVAGATGFSVSYISQLGKVEEFQQLVVALSGIRLAGEVERQDGFDSLEGVLLKQMESMAGSSGDMNELSRALDVVAKNNPKRKTLGGLGASGGDTNVSVTVHLPPHVMQPLNVVTDARNRVIEMDGQNLLPLSIKEIRGKLKEIGA